MAGVRSRKPVPVGSPQWIQEERQQLSQFQEQELEDFVFCIRNETEWLNEHMAEIFNNTQLNVTEIFKTPGKLRGKTPRTVRRRTLEARPPLAEIFSSNKRVNSSPIRQHELSKNAKSGQSPVSLEQQFPPVPKPVNPNHDSGYHGMTEDEMDVDFAEALPSEPDSAVDQMQVDAVDQQVEKTRKSTEDRTTEGSFHSARENLTSRDIAMTYIPEREATTGLEVLGSFPKETYAPLVSAMATDATTELIQQEQISKSPVVPDEDPAESPNSSVDGSSPAKPLVRKSSLTFASLPAREPLATKKSIGNQARTSNADTTKNPAFNRSSYLGRFTGGKSLGGSRNADEDRMEVDDEDDVSEREVNGKENAKLLHNKSSTQRLHDRINLLGKTQPSRPTKSISSVVTQQPTYPELRNPAAVQDDVDDELPMKNQAVAAPVDEEDDWIMPSAPKTEVERRPTLLKSRSVDVMERISGKENISGTDFGLEPGESEQARQQSPLRYQMTAEASPPTRLIPKAASTTELVYAEPTVDRGHQKAISVSNPTMPPGTTTPAGSPTTKFHLDGHLSASKSKLQSIMKSAKNLFSSSARISNQAKMETMSPSPMRIRKQPLGQGLNEIAEVSGPEHPIYPDLHQEKPAQPESPTKGRKTRSSTEKEQKKKEKEAKERQKAEEELQKVRELEKSKASRLHEKFKINASTTDLSTSKPSTLEQTSKPIRQSPRRQQNRDNQQSGAIEAKPLPPQAARPQSQASHIAKPKEIKRPVRPTKEAATKPKPQPVSIRIGTLSQRVPLSSSSLAPSQPEPAPNPQPKHATAAKKPSIASQTSTSNASFKSSISSNTSRAKAPITRKIERKPILQEDSQKRPLPRDVQRPVVGEDAKKAAQRQAIEQRRLDLGKKDQHQDAFRPGLEASRLGLAEKTQSHPPQRPGLGASRPIPKPAEAQDFPKPPIASTANTKRVFDADGEDELARPVRPTPGQSYQPNEAKRRRTEDEETLEQQVRPAMAAPPIRQSSIRKDGFKSSLFGGNYPMAPPPASIHAGSSRPPTTIQGHQQQLQPQSYSAYPPRSANPMDMAKFGNGKIPFADAPNPPQQNYKTPMSSKQNSKTQPTPKSRSPMLFQNGENIVLDEIETSEEDSEEEADKKSNLPDWARTPNMNQILLHQENVDTDAVFGPIAPANLEEWFTKDKNRLHKLRMRTSSANWFGADRLTEEEIKQDVEARQQMSKDGGWSYGLSKVNE